MNCSVVLTLWTVKIRLDNLNRFEWISVATWRKTVDIRFWSWWRATGNKVSSQLKESGYSFRDQRYLESSERIRIAGHWGFPWYMRTGYTNPNMEKIFHTRFFIRTSNFRLRLGCSYSFVDFSLKLFLNCSYFLIFLNSELVARNNTCKMALRNMCLKLSIQRLRTWSACLSLFQRPMAMTKLNSRTLSFVFM